MTLRHPRSLGVLFVTTFLAATHLGSVSAGAETTAMKTGALTSQPIGHFEFCKRYPKECTVRTDEDRPERMSEQFQARLIALTVAVNRAVKPMSDAALYGQDEFWTYPDNAGDCEEYVLEKRRTLIAEGRSAGNLLITVVRKPDGEGHAVLTVRTNVGDLILDNLNDAVKIWYETPYNYIKRQAAFDAGRWVTIRENHAPRVGSVE